MRVGTAKAAAADWVVRHASREAEFRGAYFSGSTVGMPDDGELPAASDVDVVVVTSHAEPPPKPGKFLHRGALLEVTYLSERQLASAEEVLSNYHLAGGFRRDTIIADPTGHLRSLQADVSRRFAEPAWVRRRCEDALRKIENGLRSADPAAPLHDRVLAWLFPAGVTCHVLLAAALRNPTVRLRYLAARGVLRDYGRDSLYPELLRLLGCADWTPKRAERHVAGLARTFDAAAAAARTPFPFRTDITAAARPIAIDGSLELIRAGNHREAVFWIVATYARCHKILAADAPPGLRRTLAASFEDVLADLGIASDGDLIRRSEEVILFLPRLRETAEAIMRANPEIADP
jgi:hypothetical protein